MIPALRLLQRLLLGSLIASAALACSAESPVAPGQIQTLPPIQTLPRELTSAERDVISSSNAFAFSLLHQLNREEAGKNVFVSPLSASMALGMTLNGAGGSTFEAMRETLRFSGLALPEINESYRSLIELLRGLDPAVVFQIANSIWYRQGYPVEQAFLDAVEDPFDAEIQALDFGAPASLGVINSWVKRSTAGKIPTIVDQIGPDDVMFLINAIYFKGSWTQRFDRAKTRDDLFTLADGSRKTVKLMEQEGEFGYQANELFQAADLPYGGGAFSMTVVLPSPGTDLEAFVAGLDEAAWAELVAGFSKQELMVSLPRFKLEWEKTLNETLKALGMEAAFIPGVADFTRLSSGGGLWIGEVKQKTFVEVNEEGTEAAAATAVLIPRRARPELRVDRPFLFAIRERFSGTVLFLGKIVDPPQS